MNKKLISSLIEEGFIEVYIEINHTGILGTFSRKISLEKERKGGNLIYDGNFLEVSLKEITNEMIENGKSFKRIKLKDLK